MQKRTRTPRDLRTRLRSPSAIAGITLLLHMLTMLLLLPRIGPALLALAPAPLILSRALLKRGKRAAAPEGSESIRIDEDRFRKAFDHAVTGIAMVDIEGRFLHVNQALCDLLGYTPDEMVGVYAQRFTHPDDVRRHIDHSMRLVSGEVNHYVLEKRYLHKDGRHVWTQVSVALLHGADGQPLYFVDHIQDITDRKAWEHRLTQLAERDPLTSLCNRRRFQEELERHLAGARIHGTCGAVLFLDLDGFKYVNDNLGHQTGDSLLISLADLLLDKVGSRGVVARLGGDEFAILLPDLDQQGASQIAGEVINAIASHDYDAPQQSIHLTVSGGLVPFGGADSPTAQRLLSQADMAMYHAKEEGGNRFHLYRTTPEKMTRIEAKMLWEDRIRRALSTDGFTLHAQPIIQLNTGAITHYEMLLRMRDDNGGLISPRHFLDVAERSALILEIDRWALGRGMDWIAELERAGRPVPLSVNLSARTLTDQRLPEIISAELQRTGIDPKLLVLEITETSAISDMRRALQVTHRLQRLGCRFAIDDFGRGFWSFSSLRILPFDYLKLDGSLIDSVAGDPVTRHMVHGIAEVVRRLGKYTVAEWVEDEETVAALMQAGVDYAQGYLFGRPGEPAEVFGLAKLGR